MKKGKMKKGKIIRFTLFGLMVTMLFTTVINAADSFYNQITASIVPYDPVVVNVGGGYTASVVKKHYADNGGHSGKAFCTLFDSPAPKGTCTAIAWNSNEEENKKIAAAVGEMINEARKQSGSTDGSIDWTTYLYSEMAINNFLYLHNGKNSANNVAGIYGSAKWSYISSNAKYKAIFAAGEMRYQNYGENSIQISNTRVTISEDKASVTVTSTIRCYDDSGKKIACNFSANNALKITATTTNGQNINETVTPQYSNETLNYTYSLSNDTFKASDATTNNYVTATISVTNKTKYFAAQNYKCASGTQNITPNYIPEVYDSKPAQSVKRAKYNEVPRVTCSLEINKYNQTSNQQGDFPPLKGARFELYSDAGMTETIETVTTNSAGKATFDDLDEGTYYIKETKAPTGFVISEEYKTGKAVTLAAEGENVCTKTLSIGNPSATGSLSIKKVDNNNQFVKGAKIRVYTISSNSSSSEDLEVIDNNSNEQSNSDDNYTFNYLRFNEDGTYNPNGVNDFFYSNGSVNTIEGLSIGTTYYVVEDAVPENSTYAIKVGYDSQTIKEAKNYEITLINVPSMIKISKQAIAGSEELPGAKLEIFYENGTSTGWSWESTDKPQEIVGLPDGNYVLVETTAPNGYEKAESINFTIENGKLKDDEDNVLVMKDKETVEVPDTFKASNIITMIVGLLLVTGGSVALAYEYKKRKTA